MRYEWRGVSYEGKEQERVARYEGEEQGRVTRDEQLKSRDEIRVKSGYEGRVTSYEGEERNQLREMRYKLRVAGNALSCMMMYDLWRFR